MDHGCPWIQDELLLEASGSPRADLELRAAGGI